MVDSFVNLGQPVRDEPPYQLLANAVLMLHFALVAFVVGGLVLIWVGNWRGWRWVNAWWFRVAHIAAIGVVVAQAWLGVDCALTTLEMWLREKAGMDTYQESFIAHWVQRAIYYEAPQWVFTGIYTLFGLLVAATWWRYPPKR